MTEPVLSSHELRPMFALVFKKRFRILCVFVLVTALSYLTLKILKVATYESTAVVMVKIPLIDFDARIDPNPQVAPAYLDLAMSEGVLAETYDTLVKLRQLAEPLRRQIGFEEYITKDLREGWLPKLKGMKDLRDRLSEKASALSKDWEREVFTNPDLFLALFEISPEHVQRIPLFLMRESFKAKTGIAAQTNVSILNEPFVNMRVAWSSPGAAALWANIWAHLFVDRANELTREVGITTEDSILGEASKIEDQLAALQAELARQRSAPEYQKLLQIQGLENILYGGRSSLDVFGYVEAHADISKQSGLVGKLGELEFGRAVAQGKRDGLLHRLSEISSASGEYRTTLKAQVFEAETEVRQITAQVEEAEKKIKELSQRAQSLHHEIADFEAAYKHLEFQIQQVTRIFSEKLTTSIFSRSRLKAGYAIPPMVFVEPAIPDKHPAGPPKVVLSLALGALAALFYLCWILYRGYLVPTINSGF